MGWRDLLLRDGMPLGPAVADASNFTLEAESDADRNVLSISPNPGDWSVVSGAGHSNGFARKNLNTDTTDVMFIEFRGRNVKVYGSKGPAFGKVQFRVTISGQSQLVREKDLYQEDAVDNVLLFDLDVERQPDAAQGDLDAIELNIETTNTKNVLSSANDFLIDRIVFEATELRVSAFLVNAIKKETEQELVENEGVSTYFETDNPTQLTMEIEQFDEALLILEASNPQGGATHITVALKQGVFTQTNPQLVDYVPLTLLGDAELAFANLVAGVAQARRVKLLGTILIIEVTVAGDGGGNDEMDLKGSLVKRA